MKRSGFRRKRTCLWKTWAEKSIWPWTVHRQATRDI